MSAGAASLARVRRSQRLLLVAAAAATLLLALAPAAQSQPAEPGIEQYTERIPEPEEEQGRNWTLPILGLVMAGVVGGGVLAARARRRREPDASGTRSTDL